jgi:hypothetical protein
MRSDITPHSRRDMCVNPAPLKDTHELVLVVIFDMISILIDSFQLMTHSLLTFTNTLLLISRNYRNDMRSMGIF